MSATTPALSLLLVAASVVGLAACDSPDPMNKEARYEPYRASRFFADGRMMRTPPADTVAREQPRGTGPEFTGRQDGAYVDVFPVPLTRELIERGRSRFEITCAACHGLLGDGRSVVADKMALRPPPPIAGEPAFELVRAMWNGRDFPPDGGSPTPRQQHDLPHPLGFYFEAISEGYGLMPSYADMLSIEDRWAVIAYLRALSRSQRISVARLPPDERAKLEGGGR